MSTRRDLNEGALATWDPGGNIPVGEEIVVKVRWPVEANKNDCAWSQSQLDDGTIHEETVARHTAMVDMGDSG